MEEEDLEGLICPGQKMIELSEEYLDRKPTPTTKSLNELKMKIKKMYHPQRAAQYQPFFRDTVEILGNL